MNEIKVWRNMVVLIGYDGILELLIFIVFLIMFRKRKLNLQK
jgi:hypothetical protein